MADKYLPLRKMDELQENIYLLDYIIDKLVLNGFPKVNQNEFIEIMLKLYMLELDEETYNKYIRIIFLSYGDAFQSFGFLEKSFIEHPQNMMAEILDCLVEPYFLNIWRKNKQVYKPDTEFCNALLKTENLKISKEMLMHLPCKHFYIDLSECDLFAPIKGIFVNVFILDNCDKVAIDTFLMDKDLATYSSYDILDFKNEKEIEISQRYYNSLSKNDRNSGDYITTDFREVASNQDCLFIEKIIENKSNNFENSNLNRFEASFFIYQLLTYMVSHEPQIEENPITKSTYRPTKPGTTIKNKFSEIQIHDVGIRFGKSFREQKKKNHCSTIMTRHLEQTRKSPIPHFRCAHWQGYWVGRGRTEHIVKWIEPIFVGGVESNDIVIHKM